jgi:hypothetical protein
MKVRELGEFAPLSWIGWDQPGGQFALGARLSRRRSNFDFEPIGQDGVINHQKTYFLRSRRYGTA